MKIFIPLVFFVTFVSSSFGANPENIPISFPIFDNSQNPDGFAELMVGYGDWCTSIEGLHMGIDFYAPSNLAQVVSPFDMEMHSLGAHYNKPPYYTGYYIGIGNSGDANGWVLEHLGRDVYNYIFAEQWVEECSRGIEIQPRVPIDTCSQYTTDVPLHTHIQWSHWEYNSNEDRYIIHNPWDELHNPFDYFIDSPLRILT